MGRRAAADRPPASHEWARSPADVYTEDFAERLSIHCKLPIVYWDERLSSAHAERLLREAGTAFDRKDGAVDRVAAVLLLESYLDYLRMKAEEEHSNA